ncbi:hypothetical protein BV22DRAFT_1030338 [Leucogyrophana mollusca]|uniref:Uncharacterized protein n=1 Tax=Leucogyrophana mollusca TaxID=85980 RepID=A0ACB8BSZ5_9AGAM|nr:hypothetical protein BV22DRAFT_1030338 [Leucogyrophana mollusca]
MTPFSAVWRASSLAPRTQSDNAAAEIQWNTIIGIVLGLACFLFIIYSFHHAGQLQTALFSGLWTVLEEGTRLRPRFRRSSSMTLPSHAPPTTEMHHPTHYPLRVILPTPPPLARITTSQTLPVYSAHDPMSNTIAFQ